MTVRKLTQNTYEVTCHVCDGAGLLPSNAQPFHAMLCSGCNGHGVVLLEHGYTIDTVVKFDLSNHSEHTLQVAHVENCGCPTKGVYHVQS
jgi:DnaJ-class molecular chaperone